MNTPGVSLTAVASPTPTPAQRLPFDTPNSTSPATSAISNVLTWPNVSVSRTGSNEIARHTATANANHGVHPWRRTSGAMNHQVSSAVVSTVATLATTTTSGNGRYAIGAMTSPANGG